MVDCQLQDAPEIVRAIFMGGRSEVLSALEKEDVNILDNLKRTALHAAAYCGEAEIAELLLQENARVNAKDFKWFTPLHRACASKAPQVMQVLLNRGADRNARDKSWQTPLHVAAINGSVDCARLLLDGAANVNASDRGGHTPLHHAVNEGHLELVRLLLSNGASVNAFDKCDRRAMHWAASRGLTDIIDLLCDFGAEINCRDKTQYTPLHVAAAHGHVSVIRQLVSRGAELHALTGKGNSPLHIACLNGKSEVVEVLLEAIAEHSADDASEDVTPTASPSPPATPPIAAAEAQTDASPVDTSFRLPTSPLPVSAVPRRRLSYTSGGTQQNPTASVAEAVTAQNATGLTPIHLAAVSTEGDACLERLLAFSEVRSDAESKTREGCSAFPLLDLEVTCGDAERTPLHLAAAHGRCARCRLLLERGANVFAKDRWGNTPLHLAAAHGHDTVVTILLNAGARWDAPGDGGFTPLHSAAAAGFATCLSRLLECAANDWNLRNEQTSTENAIQTDGNDFPTEYGLVVGLKDAHDRNLAHAAALGGSVDCLRLVLFAGVNPFSVDREGRTPLHLAIVSRTVGLQYAGADLLRPGPAAPASSAVFQATSASYGSSEVALILLKLGADPNAADRYGCTPLHLAAAYDTEGTLVRHLLDHGANRFAAACWPTATGSPLLQSDSQSDDVDVAEQGSTLKSRRMTDVSGSFDVVLRTSLSGCEVALATPLYYPLHLASATGNTNALRCLFEGISEREACRLVLETASMSLLQKEEDVFVLAPCNTPVTALRSSPDLTGSHFFLSPLFLAAFRGQTAAVEFLLQACSGSPVPPSSSAAAAQQGLTNRNPCGQITDPLGRTPLHYAAYAGHLETCRLLVTNPLSSADPSARDAVYQWNAVHHSAAQGHVPVVNFLLRWQMDSRNRGLASSDQSDNFSLADVGDEHGRTPLMLAAQNRHPGVIELLTLSYSPLSTSSPQVPRSPSTAPVVSGRSVSPLTGRIDAADVYGRTALHRAAANGHLECIKLLIEAGADWSKSDFRGRRAIHLAATSGQTESIEFLLRTVLKATSSTAMSAQVTTTNEALVSVFCPLDQRGFTPLHFAAYNGHANVVQILLNHTAYQRPHGNTFTAVHCAAARGHVVCLDLLLHSFGLSCLRIQDYRGRSPLHVAAVNDQVACVECILSFIVRNAAGEPVSSSSPQPQSPHPRTPEEIRLMSCFLEVVDSTGRTALMLAAAHSALSTLQLLVSLNEEAKLPLTSFLAKVDSDGLTALHHAASAADESIGLFLVEKINDSTYFNLTDRLGQTPLHLAVAAGHNKLVERLLSAGANVFAVDDNHQLPICAGAPNPRVAKCLSVLLLAMMPSLASKIPAPSSAAKTPTLDRRVRNPLTDSIHSSDSEFF
ncbi:Serine/threonine-protein phosphatase 6 regulatory ankyrin repeat subunit A [Sparganum proliferum]